MIYSAADSFSRACLKTAFCQLYPQNMICITACGKSVPNEGGVPTGHDIAGRADRIRGKYTASSWTSAVQEAWIGAFRWQKWFFKLALIY